MAKQPDLSVLLNINLRLCAAMNMKSLYGSVTIRASVQRPVDSLVSEHQSQVAALLDRDEVHLLLERGYPRDRVRGLISQRLQAGEDCLSPTTLFNILQQEEYNGSHQSALDYGLCQADSAI